MKIITMDFAWILMGYLCGSVLTARLVGGLAGKDIVGKSADKNPGTANAFLYGGVWCGLLTLCGDMAKGFLPVYLYGCYLKQAGLPANSMVLACVIAAPVVGHIWPLFFRFKGGKGIATSFGCLLGLAPDLFPVAVLAFSFLFFSLVLRISPHYYRTILTYLVAAVLMLFTSEAQAVQTGFLLIVYSVLLRMKMSTEEKGKLQVRILWQH